MKKNDTGDFSVLYVEPGDERVALFLVIAGEKKPVVLMLAEQARVFQRPDDFTALKYLKRQQNLTIIFVIAQGGQIAQMAAKNGFPVYLSMDSLIKAVSTGQVARQRTLSRPTMPLGEAASAPGISDKKNDKAISAQNGQNIWENKARRTIPLSQEEEATLSPYEKAYASGSQVASPQTPMPNVSSQTLWTANRFPQTPMPGAMPPSLAEQSRISQQLSHDMHNTRNVRTAQESRAATPLPFHNQAEPQAPATSDLHVRPGVPPTPAAPAAPPVSVTPPAPDKRASAFVKPQLVRTLRARRLSLVLLLLTIALVIGVAGSFLLVPHTLQPEAAPAPAIIGQLSYSSSGQVSENSSQGIADQVVADFNNLPDPAPHKSYYVWLLSDERQSDPRSIALGPLQVNKGQAHLLYAGDAQHSNLLLITSRVLVTEEDATVPPISPTLEPGAWRFYGAIPSEPINSPNNPQHYSYLSHLRHLLAADPTLDELELQGGLNNWLYQNTGKVLEWAGSTRGQWEETKDTGYVRRQATRVLEYLDGTTFLYKDLPKGSPLLVNERLARIGLLAVNGPNQDPPSYLAHINKHLNGLLQASTVTPVVRKQANDLISAMSNVEFWLTQVRHDAQQLMKMSDEQMRQPATLTVINDMIENANRAYTGELDPSTNSTRQGIIWVHEHMQTLAHIDITNVEPNANGLVPQIVPPGGQPRAFTPYSAKK